MKSWYKIVKDVERRDGTTDKVDRLVFETTDKDISKRVENFFRSIMDEVDTSQIIRDMSGTHNEHIPYAEAEYSVSTPQTEQTDCPWK